MAASRTEQSCPSGQVSNPNLKNVFFYSFFENLMHAYNILLCFKGYKIGILAHVYDTSTQKAKSRGFS